MRSCSICGKSYKKSLSRSHSMRASIRKLKSNLQWVTINSRRIKACTKCIKTLSKSKSKK